VAHEVRRGGQVPRSLTVHTHYLRSCAHDLRVQTLLNQGNVSDEYGLGKTERAISMAISVFQEIRRANVARDVIAD